MLLLLVLRRRSAHTSQSKWVVRVQVALAVKKTTHVPEQTTDEVCAAAPCLAGAVVRSAVHTPILDVHGTRGAPIGRKQLHSGTQHTCTGTGTLW
jgi:hypothetical protein